MQLGGRPWFLAQIAATEALLIPSGKIQAHVQTGEGEYPPEEIPLCLPQSLAARCQQQPRLCRAADPGAKWCLMVFFNFILYFVFHVWNQKEKLFFFKFSFCCIQFLIHTKYKCEFTLLFAQSWIFLSFQSDSSKGAEHRSPDLHWQHKGSALQQQSSALH